MLLFALIVGVLRTGCDIVDLDRAVVLEIIDGVDTSAAALLDRPARLVLLLRPDGQKLGKASGDTGIRELRARGVDSETVIGMAAAAIGLIGAARPLPAHEVPALFAEPGAGLR